MKPVPHKHNIKTMKQQMSDFDVFSGGYRINKNYKIQPNEQPKAQETTQQQRHRKHSCKACPISKYFLIHLFCLA